MEKCFDIGRTASSSDSNTRSTEICVSSPEYDVVSLWSEFGVLLYLVKRGIEHNAGVVAFTANETGSASALFYSSLC